MDVTIDEIRRLRTILEKNRLEHEALVTQARLIRQQCRQVRELWQKTQTAVSLKELPAA